MSGWMLPELGCDELEHIGWNGSCVEVLRAEPYEDTLAELRTRARSHGWVQAYDATGKAIDLCPACAPAPPPPTRFRCPRCGTDWPKPIGPTDNRSGHADDPQQYECSSPTCWRRWRA